MYFLPAGRVHTIGKGLLIAEIQQTSDITYRIYDFDRTDDKGNKRELHVEEALDAIDFRFHENYKTEYDREAPITELVNSDYFVTNRLEIQDHLKRDYSHLDSCTILMCLEGSGEIKFENGSTNFKLGDSILIPKLLSDIDIVATATVKLLEVHIP